MHVAKLFDLTGRVAVVTGGSTGLGEEIAESFLEAGAAVVIASRKVATLQATAERLRHIGPAVLPMPCDVGDPQQVAELAAKVVGHFGRVDILVNNAGVSWGAPAEQYPLDRFQQLLQVNVTGCFACAQAFGRHMLAQGRGKIINIASILGLVAGDPAYMHAVGYNASKGAIIAMTKELGVKWAPRGVQVNALAPGWFPSKMSRGLITEDGERMIAGIPAGRFGEPDDFKGAVLFLASDAGNYVVGQTLVVDGGYVAW